MKAIPNWHEDAEEKFKAILDYYEKEGFYQAAHKFETEVEKRISDVMKFPGRGRLTSDNRVKYILVDKYRRMYYTVVGDDFYILDFFDARQHPDKSPF